jgi:hypothetical protein
VDSLTFYFDRCFGKCFPNALTGAKPPFRIEYQHSNKNQFKADMRDDDWLEICGTRKWVAFSHDHFSELALVAEAIKQHRVAAFALWGAQLPTWDKLCHFFRAYPRVNFIIKTERPPYVYRIKSNLRFVRVSLP